MQKIVIFGGGSGLSQILKGLKLFPVEVTAIVSAADNGGSTGTLRKEFNIPAVGDISKVMVAMADTNRDIIKLLNYRFEGESSLTNHSIKNLILTALLDIKGDFTHAIPVMCKMFNIKGTILPISEDYADLVGITDKKQKIIGEEQITKSKAKVIEVKYDKKVKANPKVLKAISEADLIILSSGSLLTSILPNIIIPEVKKALDNAKAPIAYICNLVTQPGETDGFIVSDHLDFINQHLSKKKVAIVIANNRQIDQELAQKYYTEEQKDPVVLDKENLRKMGIEIIDDSIYTIENGILRHDSLKTAYLIFSYLMRNEKWPILLQLKKK